MGAWLDRFRARKLNWPLLIEVYYKRHITKCDNNNKKLESAIQSDIERQMEGKYVRETSVMEDRDHVHHRRRQNDQTIQELHRIHYHVESTKYILIIIIIIIRRSHKLKFTQIKSKNIWILIFFLVSGFFSGCLIINRNELNEKRTQLSKK